MNNKIGASTLVSSIIFLVILFVGFGVYLFLNNKAKAPSESLNTNNVQTSEIKQEVETNPEPAPTTVATKTEINIKDLPSTYSSGEEIAPSPDIQVVAINYDGKAFSPSSVNIKVGDYVIFYNKSSASFWPASADHPTHTQYPELNANKAIEAGGKFQFQFLKLGAWSFHDHLNPSVTGVVNVEK